MEVTIWSRLAGAVNLSSKLPAPARMNDEGFSLKKIGPFLIYVNLGLSF
jgi:hypothetical protein